MRAQSLSLRKQVLSFKIKVTEAEKAAMPPVREMRESTAKAIHEAFGGLNAGKREHRYGTDKRVKPLAAPARAERRETPSSDTASLQAAVHAGNGKDRSKPDEEFEEF
jgi:hypothetical protein